MHCLQLWAVFTLNIFLPVEGLHSTGSAAALASAPIKVGRIGLVICYDDTYWQYPRLAALRGAQIIGWHSVSDRVMPGTPAAEATGNHSTVSNVQYMSAQNGVWVVAATRSGIETNPITG